jgi:hypothetical protein
MASNQLDPATLKLPEYGLYYPFINFRDDQWLKIAALYWPKIARIVPAGYATRDSETTRALIGELGFVINLEPDPVRADVSKSFSSWLDGVSPSQIERWRISHDDARAGGVYMEPPDADRIMVPQLLADEDLPATTPNVDFSATRMLLRSEVQAFAGVHESELEHDLQDRLRDERLAVASRVGWLAMHPELAWLYKCHLTSELAARNLLTPATDQLPAHALTTGLRVDLKASETKRLDITTSFGLLAIDAVVPHDLRAVPIKKIIEVRHRFGRQFDMWRREVDKIGAALASQLQDIDSPTILNSYLDDAVRSYSNYAVDDLRRGLADTGLESAMTAMNIKFQLPAGLAVAGLGAAPPIAAGVGIAAGVVNLRHQTRKKAQARMTVPASYLLSMRETLADTTFLEKIAAAIRRTAGLRGLA